MATVRKRKWVSGGKTQEAWLACYVDQERKRRFKTFATKKAADVWLIQARHEVQRGVHTPASTSITINEAGELWIAQAETDGLEASTVTQYRQHLRHHIAPFVGTVKLASFGPPDLSNFRNSLTAQGRSRAMVKGVTSSLGAILATAMANGKVSRNVVREQARQTRRHNGIAKRHKRQLEVGVDIPTKDEVRAMLTHAQDRWRPLIITAIFSGLRASELRGLRWDDV